MDVKTLAKKLQPILAIMIMLMLIFLVKELAEYNKLQKEINENCGWVDENYKCYCKYADVVEFTVDDIDFIGDKDVPLVG